MIEFVAPYFSTASRTTDGSKYGTVTRRPPVTGVARIAPIEAAWNIGT